MLSLIKWFYIFCIIPIIYAFIELKINEINSPFYTFFNESVYDPTIERIFSEQKEILDNYKINRSNNDYFELKAYPGTEENAQYSIVVIELSHFVDDNLIIRYINLTNIKNLKPGELIIAGIVNDEQASSEGIEIKNIPSEMYVINRNCDLRNVCPNKVMSSNIAVLLFDTNGASDFEMNIYKKLDKVIFKPFLSKFMMEFLKNRTKDIFVIKDPSFVLNGTYQWIGDILSNLKQEPVSDTLNFHLKSFIKSNNTWITATPTPLKENVPPVQSEPSVQQRIEHRTINDPFSFYSSKCESFFLTFESCTDQESTRKCDIQLERFKIGWYIDYKDSASNLSDGSTAKIKTIHKKFNNQINSVDVNFENNILNVNVNNILPSIQTLNYFIDKKITGPVQLISSNCIPLSAFNNVNESEKQEWNFLNSLSCPVAYQMGYPKISENLDNCSIVAVPTNNNIPIIATISRFNPSDDEYVDVEIVENGTRFEKAVKLIDLLILNPFMSSQWHDCQYGMIELSCTNVQQEQNVDSVCKNANFIIKIDDTISFKSNNITLTGKVVKILKVSDTNAIIVQSYSEEDKNYMYVKVLITSVILGDNISKKLNITNAENLHPQNLLCGTQHLFESPECLIIEETMNARSKSSNKFRKRKSTECPTSMVQCEMNVELLEGYKKKKTAIKFIPSKTGTIKKITNSLVYREKNGGLTASYDFKTIMENNNELIKNVPCYICHQAICY